MAILITILWMLATWLLFAFLAAVPTWALWNWLMPDMFNLPSIGLVQAFGLLFLSSLIFGSRQKMKLAG